MEYSKFKFINNKFKFKLEKSTDVLKIVET